MQRRNNLIYMSYLRAIALLLVMISHIGFILFDGNNLSYFSFGPHIRSVHFLGSILFFLGKIGLNIFFIISGYLILYSGKKYTIYEFIVNRFFKFIPTYIVCLCIIYIMQYYSYLYWDLYYFHDISVIKKNFFLYDILFQKQPYLLLGITWTLKIEFIFYLFYILFRSVLKNHFLTFIIYTLTYIALLYYAITLQDKILLMSLQYLIPIYSGMKIYYEDYKSGLFVLIISMIPIYLLSESYSVISFSAYSMSIIGFLIVIFFKEINFLLLENKKLNHIVNYIKDISYPIYLIHFVLMCILYTVAFHQEKYYLYILSFPLIFIISTLIHYLIEKPLIRFHRRIFNIN